MPCKTNTGTWSVVSPVIKSFVKFFPDSALKLTKGLLYNIVLNLFHKTFYYEATLVRSYIYVSVWF